jgi:hypothetical protein
LPTRAEACPGGALVNSGNGAMGPLPARPFGNEPDEEPLPEGSWKESDERSIWEPAGLAARGGDGAGLGLFPELLPGPLR